MVGGNQKPLESICLNFFGFAIIFDQVNSAKTHPSNKSGGNLVGKWDRFTPKRVPANPERSSAAPTTAEAAFSKGLSRENRALRAETLRSGLARLMLVKKCSKFRNWK